MSSVLELTDVVVEAGSLRILDGINLSVDSGEILAVVGPNGAGKTTLLDAVSGVAPGRGNGGVVIDGQEGGTAAGRPRAGVGRVFQGSPLPETLTLEEVAALVSGGHEEGEELLSHFGLLPHASSFVAELSTGMRRILDIAVSTQKSPKVLLLDEPASGLAQGEIEELASVIKRFRDSSGAAVVMVEHDAWLVRAVADRVAVLAGGKVLAEGPPDTVLDSLRSEVKPRLRSPSDPEFQKSLERVTKGATRPAPVSRQVSSWTIARLALRDLAAGLASVLLLGVLNRVLKVEMGVSLGVVAAVLASYNLAAPIALIVGHRSDRHPIRGKRREPYIIAGAIIAGTALIATPHVATRLADGVTLGNLLASVAVFVAMGFGMWGGGTVFLALLADVVPPDERPHAISVTYIMLMVGVMTGVVLTVTVIEKDGSNLGTLFAFAGILVIVLSTIAVWGKEPPISKAEMAVEYVPFRKAFGSIAKMGQARLYFLFSTFAVLFLFLQQSVLEPYGGDVLGLSIRATSTFNAVMFVGILVGMWLAGRPFAAHIGHKQMAKFGLWTGFGSFGALTLAARVGSVPGSWLAILAVGLATGVFTVAGLALMMGMVDKRRTALFMGVWTIGRAIADASAVAGGGLVFELALRYTGREAPSYAAVFAISAVGLLLLLPVLRGISPDKFRKQAEAVNYGEPKEAVL